jgi:hypothetical protein
MVIEFEAIETLNADGACIQSVLRYTIWKKIPNNKFLKRLFYTKKNE